MGTRDDGPENIGADFSVTEQRGSEPVVWKINGRKDPSGGKVKRGGRWLGWASRWGARSCRFVDRAKRKSRDESRTKLPVLPLSLPFHFSSFLWLVGWWTLPGALPRVDSVLSLPGTGTEKLAKSELEVRLNCERSVQLADRCSDSDRTLFFFFWGGGAIAVGQCPGPL